MAPSTAPTAGTVAAEPAVTPGAGAGASAARATVAEAATRTAQAIFFISIASWSVEVVVSVGRGERSRAPVPEKNGGEEGCCSLGCSVSLLLCLRRDGSPEAAIYREVGGLILGRSGRHVEELPWVHVHAAEAGGRALNSRRLGWRRTLRAAGSFFDL